MKTLPAFIAIMALLAILAPFLLNRNSNLEAPQYSYNIVSSCSDCNGYSFQANLAYQGPSDHFINDTNKVIQSPNFTFCFLTPYQLNIRIIDSQNDRWEVPKEFPYPHNDPSATCIPLDQALAEVDYVSSPFSFSVKRKNTGEVIFNTENFDLIFSDYYLELSTPLPTSNLYGLGERHYQLDLGTGGTFTIFNKDQGFNLEDATAGHNLYGYHPVYLQRENSGKFSMVLLRSSNAMDVVIENQVLTYKVIGGVIDLNFFLGGDDPAFPETVVKQYHTYVGGWIMHPFWAFGHHQSQYGFKNAQEMETVLANYQSHDLILDVIWSDIDYMKDYVDFIIDDANFPPSQMNNMLQTYQKRWVPIVDAGIAINNNPYFNKSIEEQIYIRDPDGEYLLGKVWPGDVHFPDFTNPNTSAYWSFGLDLLHSQIPFSGIWIDMNEASNFVDGEENWSPNSDDLANLPPYVPATPGTTIYQKAMRMDATHYDGSREFDAHNFFGFLESQATYEYLNTLSNLTFILSRSTFYGSGQFTAHWTGDNGATWDFLKTSLPDCMTFNIFGIPMVGPDICGFMGNTTEELCSRWYQASTLYPFSRNHNANDAIPQEPYAMGPTLLTTARITLQLRYALLKHMYALFLRNEGLGTVFRPLFFEFPTDQTFFDHSKNFVNSEYLVGDSLVFAPVLDEGQDTVEVYLPQGTWFDIVKDDLVQNSSESNPQPFQYPAPLNFTVPFFMRGGHILGWQDTTNVSSTADLNDVYTLMVSLQEQNYSVFYANGPLLGIHDMSDLSIVSKCLNGKNCVYNVQSVFTFYNNNYVIGVTFNLPNSGLQDDQVRIDTIIFNIALNRPGVSVEDIAYADWHWTDESGIKKEVVVDGSDYQIVFSNPDFWTITPGKVLTFNGHLNME